ncbi:hypothetical protein DSO57_1008186 [Entomophthora muscae]|uniref:Uncharacterized protein n=1 Tax=Entomophthora muscae TaxID=34485 RepID=A0ACC2U5C4_9FUNG|nr:hypothetical protein DSO57_1008186 [Entomophthora muscae]
MEGFTFKSLLNQDPSTKSVILLGTKLDPETKTERDAILMLEKLHFVEREIPSLNADSGRLLDINMSDSNDVYSWFKAKMANNFTTGQDASDHSPLNDVEIQLIFPASKNHIAKYSYQPRHMIVENYELFKKVISPVIDGFPPQNLTWVHNLIAGISEKESILYHDKDAENGFALSYDSKWDRRTISSLYLLVIVNRKDIRCLRDLNQSHLPMLKNIINTVPGQVEKAYSGQIKADQLRLFIHYPPTYYHFHVHVVNTHNVNAPGMTVGQAHMLSSVIENIENFDSNYYQKVTMHYSLGDQHSFYKAIKEQASK